MRIIGIENEYGATTYRPGTRRVARNRLTELFGGYTRRWLPNGACYYVDGDNPEYATPECRSLRDLIAHERAGERYVDARAQGVEARTGADVYVFKNNTDGHGATHGSHENHELNRELLDLLVHRSYRPRPAATATLAAFFATRPLLAGSGGLLRAPRSRTTRFVLSPRAEHIAVPYSASTTDFRGMFAVFHYRPNSEPHGRLHVICGDSTRSEVTALLRSGTTRLVLDMICDGVAFDDLELRDPVEALRRTSREATGATRLELADGGTTPAVAIQRAFCDRARAFCTRNGSIADPETALLLHYWDSTVTALERGDTAALSRTIDWAIKKSVIEDYRTRHDLPLHAPRLARLDLAYADIRPGRGVFSLLEQRGRVDRVVTDADIERAMTCAPQTRAALRAAVIRRAEETGRNYTGNWGRLSMTAADGHTWQVCSRQPGVARNAAVETLTRQ